MTEGLYTKRRLHAGLDLRRSASAHAQGEGDIFADGQVREQRVVLEYETDVASVHRHVRFVAPIDEDASAGRLDETADHLQERRFARARRAEQRQEFAGRDREMSRLERHGLAVALRQSIDQKLRRVRRACWRHDQRLLRPTGRAPLFRERTREARLFLKPAAMR
jgi:hypothetical protein